MEINKIEDILGKYLQKIEIKEEELKDIFWDDLLDLHREREYYRDEGRFLKRAHEIVNLYDMDLWTFKDNWEIFIEAQSEMKYRIKRDINYSY